MHIISILSVLAPIYLGSTFTSALPTQDASVTLPLPSRVVYQFPETTWIENLAVRSDSHLLLSLLLTPELYLLDPFSTNPPVLVHTFSNYLSLLGITEAAPDLFYVITGNFSVETLDPGAGSYSIHSVDFRACQLGVGAPYCQPTVEKALDIPEATFLNSLVTISPNVLLTSDSGLGVVFRIDLAAKTYTTVLDYPEMKPHPAPGVAGLNLGINGLGLHDGHLYFSNTFAGMFYRLPLTSTGYGLSGAAVETLTENTFTDDFNFGPAGADNVFLCEGISNRITVVDGGKGNTTVVLGQTDMLTVAGPTSARFGRTARDIDILYVTTTGGLASPVNGTLTEPGKVIAIDTSSWK